jgi:hypothetical protein
MSEQERKRYYAVRHSWTVVHEYVGERDAAEFALTENACSSNTIAALQQVCEICDPLCNVCQTHKAEIVAVGDELEEVCEGAIPLSADYWRERMREYDENGGAR